MKKITLTLIFGFMALISYSQVGLVENFDAGLTLPTGWTSDAEDYAVAFVQNCDGRSVRANLDDTNTDAQLTSPNFVGESNGTDLTISFDYKIVDWSEGIDGTVPGWGEILVQYSTNDGAAWTTVETINDANHITADDCANFATTVLAVDLPTGSDFKLRFDANWTAGAYYIYIDNVSATQVVSGPPSCVSLITPTNASTGVSINTDLEWTVATNIPTGYTVIVGTTPGGTEIVDNENAGLSTTYNLPILDYSTTYYVTIIPFNANGNALNCEEFTFTTGADPNAPVDCAAGTPINTVYCYDNNETQTWNFQSSDGSPLNIFFNAGEMEACCDQVTIYDGIDNTGTVLFDANNGGDMNGVSITAPSGTMFVEIDSDGSVSCQANNFTPLDFDVSCVDTTALPNCNAALTTPVNGAVAVDINTDLTWSPASILVTGYTLSIGTTPGGTDIVNGLDVGNVTTYDPGILLYETIYYVTIVPYNDNGDAINCNEESFTTENDPNQILDCSVGEVVNTVYCYTNNDTMEFNFASNDGSPLVVVFNSGTTENNWDELIVLDSDGVTNLNEATPYGAGGNLTGLTFTSSGNSITVGVTSDGSVISCTNDPWNFDVSCVDTTALPNCNASLTAPLNGAVGVNENDDLTWSPATIFVTGYTLFVGTTPGGTDIVNGLDVGNVTTYDPGLFPFDTVIYVTIVPYNDNGDAMGCTEESFTTRSDPNQILDCSVGEVVNTVYCYTNNDTMEFNFASNDGSPLVVVFNSGTTENNFDELIVLDSDGVTNLNAATPYGAGGNLTGLTFTSSGNSITVGVTSDGSVISCANNPWDFDVSCLNTAALPNCNASLTAPLNGAVGVNENDDLTWSPATIFVTGYTLFVGTTPGGTDIVNGLDVGNVTTYDPGLLPFDTVIYVTIVPYNDNGDAMGCTEESFTTRPDPNQILDCSVGEIINTVYCYTNNDTMEFNFASNDGSPLAVFFNSGQTENGWDELVVTDSDGTVIYNDYGNAGDLTGLSFFSTGNSITIGVTSDGIISCDNQGYTPWDFDVFCFDPTAPPNCNSVMTIPADGAIDVDINSDITWSPASIVVTGYEISIGTTPGGTDVLNSFDVGDVLTYDPGTLVNATEYFVTIVPYNDNGLATEDCEEQSFQTICIPQVVTFNAIGDCETDPDNPDFVLEVTITDLSGSASIIITDDQGSPAQTATTTGVITMGPYAANTVVTITTIKSDDDTCDVISSPITFICPPPPNPCSIVYAGDDVTVDCADTSTDLEANFHLFGQDTSQYIINGLDTCPQPTTVGGTPTSLDIDDTWSEVLDLGFEFCFFGETYSQILVGSNGVLSFELENVGNFNGWNIDPGDTLPNAANLSLGQANIFGVAHDIDPSVCGDINYLVVGSAPYRQFVVNYTNICHFDCNDLLSSSQIILYESSNNIDVNVFDKPVCTTWNDGNAVIGVQNIAGDVAFTPPGRNTGVWTATDEFWRFAPSEGTPNYTFEWFDGATSLGNTEIVTVSPTETTTYTASVTYELCTGGTATITDEVIVEVIDDSVDTSFTMTPTCTGGTATITGDTGGTFTFNPVPTDGAMIDSVTGEVTGVTSLTTYTIEYSITSTCTTSNTQELTVLIDDATFNMTATCDGGTATITGDTGGTFTFNPVPTDGAMIDGTTGEVTGGVSGVIYTIEYTTSGECPATSMQTLTVFPEEDATFTMVATCDGGTATITGDAGGMFTFNPVPTDGAVIDATTGEVIGGVSGVTYTIEYTTSGSCSEASTQTVTVLPGEDASFTMEATCDGGTATITGDAGGMFAFNPVPIDGALIDATTGEVTVGVSGVTYTIEYTTSGSCSEASTQTVTVLPGEDASFTMAATCDGGTATITGNAGGMFAFNPVPTDGAVIDAATGEVTEGVSGVTYTIEYTTSGECPTTSSVDLMVLPEDDATFTMAATCDGGTATITGDAGGMFTFNPVPTDGAVIDATTGEVTGGVSGVTYTIEYTTSGECPATSMQTLTVFPEEDATFTMVATCDGGTATITGDAGGMFTFNPVPTDGALIDATTGEVTGGTAGETYTIEYTTSGPCTEASTQTVTVLPGEDASFTMAATCDGGTATITGDTGGMFVFNPDLADGAMIDPVTGEVTNGVSGTTYTVEYTTVGVCPDTTTETVTVLPADNATFTMTATCDGGTATITGDTGGMFVFNPDPADGAMIDPVTGEVTNGVSGTTYTVEYTTVGVCPDTNMQMVTTLIDVFDFTVVGDCNGAIYELTVTPVGNSYDPNTVNYTLYDDMNSLLQTNTTGDNIFVIDASIFTAPMSGSTYNYVVEVTDSSGCVETNEVLVETINCVIPQGISPNNDGKNDNFDLTGYDVSRLEIFNRHGVKVYSKTEYTNDWYGQSDKGDELPVGTYFYVMEYQGSKTRTSWIYLNREN